MRWTSRRAVAVLILCNLLWAGSYSAGKEALRVLSPIELNGLRFGIAALVLVPLALLGQQRPQIRRRDLPQLAVLCLLGFVLNKASEFAGLSLTTASDTALLIACEGIFTALLGWIVLREPIHRLSMLGLLFGVCGVYVVLMQGLTLPHLDGGTRLLGDLLVVLSLVFESVYTISGKAILERYSGLFIIAVSVGGSMFVWVPLGALNLAHSGLPPMTATTWVAVLYLAIFVTVVAYVGWMVALRYVAASTAATTLFLRPLVGTALAVLLLGERPSPASVAGGCCILFGVWLARRTRSVWSSLSS